MRDAPTRTQPGTGAIVRKPDVILLDEATSALDNENEALVQKSLDVLAKQGSALVIAQ